MKNEKKNESGITKKRKRKKTNKKRERDTKKRATEKEQRKNEKTIKKQKQKRKTFQRNTKNGRTDGRMNAQTDRILWMGQPHPASPLQVLEILPRFFRENAMRDRLRRVFYPGGRLWAPGSCGLAQFANFQIVLFRTGVFTSM